MDQHQHRIAVALSLACGLAPALSAQTQFSASGPNAAAIQGTVDSFRTALGTLNPNNPGSAGSGRREIDWEDVTDAQAARALLPGDFYNLTSPRGVVLTTVEPGYGFQVSADGLNSDMTLPEFGHITPSYTMSFEPFSGARMFSPRGTNVFDVVFRIPGDSHRRAASRAFGAVFTDVDLVGDASLEFFRGNESLGSFPVPATAGDGSLSFLGVDFGANIVTRVRVTCGTAALGDGAEDLTINQVNPDLVVTDDFIFGEPVALVPTIAGIAGNLGQLRVDIDGAIAQHKLEKQLLNELDAALAAVDRAFKKENNGKHDAATKLLKSGAQHLRQFEFQLDRKRAGLALDDDERVGFADRAATIGVDFATLIYG